jgi:hypothetical protein
MSAEQMPSLLRNKQTLQVIFLDIDGVLLPFGENNNKRKKKKHRNNNNKPESLSGLFPDHTLRALDCILEHFPKAVLVLSSTWRVCPNACNDILEAFRSYNNNGQQYGGRGYSSPRRARLQNIKDFYDVTNVETHSERQWEIYEWLQQHNNANIEAWIALDDEDLVEGPNNQRYRHVFQGHTIKTKSSVGLTQKDAKKAIQMLNAQLQLQHDIIECQPAGTDK